MNSKIFMWLWESLESEAEEGRNHTVFTDREGRWLVFSLRLDTGMIWRQGGSAYNSRLATGNGEGKYWDDSRNNAEGSQNVAGAEGSGLAGKNSGV